MTASRPAAGRLTARAWRRTVPPLRGAASKTSSSYPSVWAATTPGHGGRGSIVSQLLVMGPSRRHAGGLLRAVGVTALGNRDVSVAAPSRGGATRAMSTNATPSMFGGLLDRVTAAASTLLPTPTPGRMEHVKKIWDADSAPRVSHHIGELCRVVMRCQLGNCSAARVRL